MNKCSICGKYYEGFGNNADPVSPERCCDLCNTMHVIPARILNMQRVGLSSPLSNRSVKQAIEQAVLEHNWHDEHALTVLCDFIFTRGPATVVAFHEWLERYIIDCKAEEDRHDDRTD